MSGSELSQLQDRLAQVYLERGPSALAQALTDDLDHDDRMGLLMVTTIARAQALPQSTVQ